MTKGEETRTAILDVALEIASCTGFTALTVGGLAERAGMSKSGLFAHFRSKEQLQLDTLEHARRRFIDAVVRPTLTAPRGERRLRELFERWLAWNDEGLPGGCIFVTGAAEFDDQPGPMRDALVRDQADWLALISSVAGTAVAEGDFRPDVDTDQLAFELQALILGHHHAVRLLHDERAEERTRAAFEARLAAARAV